MVANAPISHCVNMIFLSLPAAAPSSAIFKQTGVMAETKFPMPKEITAIGIAKAAAASTPFPIEMANAVAKTPPILTSGGI